MLKSMYSGISGMKSNQTKMDVIGNNVANVGTTGFKKSGARFTDALNQTLIHASTPTGGIGGTNPGQVGIGSKVSGIFKYMKQGSLQPTGRVTDMAIDGEGFFVVERNGEIAYTRDGSFSLDKNGNLVTADGFRVLDNNGNPIIIPTKVNNGGRDKSVTSVTVSKDGTISLGLEDGAKVENHAKLRIAVFQNPEGLNALSGNLYSESANSGAAVYDAKYGSIIQGAIEMSNVDLSEEFTDMIVTTRAFQASSKVITTSDELLQEIINLKR
ncbi:MULTISPECIES: flagellar basal-body rod protein FlgF [Clostridium]|uniref:Flagellar hook protein FlgE n=1 Tax=Clostridium cadaveris TaxID=1529 RepID=A0A1I2LVW7_9CLOT|nr:flagellar basal-body rod protein FlgF [Clostridium cadaveris]MDU4950836.1 flagellar basal-body rod protein FlgF [Clostridium sp.]MDM8312338.1 flagellar basal-body rod protein FlgF [Clostridium cadaveris]MDY4948514.1 flagellar basal-body rod protein FlgF [Clostridium cadaveris]NME63750.1 flagellar basal-body rod protein FlgF [Clostridium cadaveris]SFF83415.1 flagellar hook protein FlgE [Clostridium cadaveris]